MGAAVAVALSADDLDVGGQAGPKVCRRGHPMTPANSRRTARGVQCLTCRPVGRKCEGCGEMFVGRGALRTKCDDCRSPGPTTAPRRATTPGVMTRVCAECATRHDLDEFELSATAGRRGQSQYAATCEECRTKDSPFALARRQVERIFGRPSSEWMNRGRHPLNVLHHARMVSINNSRPGTPYIPVRPTWDLMTAWRLIKRAGLTQRLQQKRTVTQ